jgi:hypothetical protein
VFLLSATEIKYTVMSNLKAGHLYYYSDFHRISSGSHDSVTCEPVMRQCIMMEVRKQKRKRKGYAPMVYFILNMSYLYEHPPAPNRIINYEPNNEQI